MNERNLACLAGSLALLSACSSYDFAAARKPDGELDVARLITDLKASGKEQLVEGLWIPLLWCDVTTFGPAARGYPAGYTLSEFTSVGPLFCAGHHDRRHLDTNGGPIERVDRDWFGWGILFHDTDERIETPSGPRLESSRRYALILGRDHTWYQPQERAAGTTP